MPALLGLLVSFGAWLLRGLVVMAPYFLAKLVASIGVAVVFNEFVVGPLEQHIHTVMTGMPQVAADVVVATGFDQAISIVFAAYAIAQASKIAIAKKVTA